MVLFLELMFRGIILNVMLVELLLNGAFFECYMCTDVHRISNKYSEVATTTSTLGVRRLEADITPTRPPYW